MKKIFINYKNYTMAFLAIVMVTVIGVNIQIAMESQKDSSDVTLKNIEALSTPENNTPVTYGDVCRSFLRNEDMNINGVLHHCKVYRYTCSRPGEGPDECPASIYRDCDPAY